MQKYGKIKRFRYICSYETYCYLIALMKRIVISLMTAAVGISSFAAGFSSRDVKIRNERAGLTLAGTVTIPESAPRAAIVMATGSGPQNRDEEVFGHRPFRAIAEYLSDHGYLVLRMDDRGVGESEGGEDAYITCTTADFAGDITAGLQWLDSCYTGVPKGVMGHSEGGAIALMCAPECDFIVTLAGPAWSGDSIVMSQCRAAAVALTGRWDGESMQRRLLDVVKGNLPDFQARIILTSILNEAYGEMAAMPMVQERVGKQVDVLLAPWYRAFVRYNPSADAAAVKVPWLALNGEKDTQVLPGNLDTFRELNPAVTTVLLPDHNHLFQHCVTGLTSEYVTIGEDFSAEALEAILKWLDSTI